jgi:phage terminase large subunit
VSRALNLPNDWTPRDYQLEMFQALDSGIKSALAVWHRRSGKDNACLNYVVKKAHERVGTYYYMLPTNKQARKVIWMNIDTQGRRLMQQAAPEVLRKRTLDDEMLCEFRNGSILQCVGSDNFDSLVGSNPVGLVYSEYALSDPRAREYLRPILVANGGFEIVNSTPRGRNHLWTLLQMAKKNPAWFWSIKTILDTGVMTMEQYEAEILGGYPRNRAEQEYLCSFDARNTGSIFLDYIEALERAGKLTEAPYDPRYPVETTWDIGKQDATVIWFRQKINNVWRYIDYHEERGQTLPHFAKIIHAKPYAYSRHIWPHDGKTTEWGAGNTRTELARQHGLRVTIAPKLAVEARIEAARAVLPRCEFDRSKCSRGLLCMRHYQYEIEEQDSGLVNVNPKPLHDWSSHACDAFTYGAVTPDHVGHLPDWLKEVDQRWRPDANTTSTGNKITSTGMMGHNGGPALQEYDPLAEFR